MRRSLPVITLVVVATSMVFGQEETTVRNPHKAMALSWTQAVLGRNYYLKDRRRPLLMNDEVSIAECVIRYRPTTNLETDVTRDAYIAKLLFRGVRPVPDEQFRLTVDDFQSLEELNAWLGNEFSIKPLEDAYDWPPEIKRAVRYRYISLGMDEQMVALALGGLPYQVDVEKLDDGRVRETWKLEWTGDTRKVYTTRSSFLLESTQSSQVMSTIHAFTSALGASNTFSIFSGLPPQFLNIVFTDGKVTARKTEFVK